ncbi:MAG: UMP kinase [Candidatus Eisenbacteria bacterium]|nr:UMP kinase [Candidatus Eisenbacteria bacterium]
MAPGPYRRVLLKLSGEMLAGTSRAGIDRETLAWLGGQIKTVHERGVDLGLVVGGGNIYRGLQGTADGMDRGSADSMGMLATIINALALQDTLERIGVDTRVMTAVRVDALAEPYIRRRAIRHLEKRRVVLLAGGTGNPFFTTDTAAALRAAELRAELLAKATRVEGIYSADPERTPTATRYKTISYSDFLRQDLKVMDATAVTLCRENAIPIVVFHLEKDNLVRLLAGEEIGTTVKEAV